MAKKKTSKKTTAKKATSKKKTSKKGSGRVTYAEALKKKVVQAIKKGMTHAEASKTHKVGIHSIPNWIKKHS